MLKAQPSTRSNTINQEKHTKAYSSISQQGEETPRSINNNIPAIPNDMFNKLSLSFTSEVNKDKRNSDVIVNKEASFSSDDMTMKEEEDCDNDYERNDCFIRLKLEEWNSSFYTLITIASSLMYHDRSKIPDPEGIAVTNISLYNATINLSLVFTTISVVLFILSSINRYLILLKLNKSTFKIPKRTTFWNINYFPSFLMECIVALFHPNILLKGMRFTTSSSWFLQEVEYEINDFLVLIVICRVYVVFRLVFSITIYYSSRSARIAQLIGSKLTRVFAIKCLIVVHPFYLLTIVGIFMVVMLSFMLKVLEGQTFSEERQTHDFRQIQNCLWNILVTMTTVGYGDYYPITNFGRIVNVLASIGGSCLISLLTLSLQNALAFQDYEAKAFRTREKELMKEKIEQKAGRYFKASIDYLLARKKFRRVRRDNEVNREERKISKKEMEKALYNKIEKKREFRDAIQFFRNIYEIPTETEVLKTKMDEFQDDLNALINQTNDMNTMLEDINQMIQSTPIKDEPIPNDSSSILLNFSST